MMMMMKMLKRQRQRQRSTSVEFENIDTMMVFEIEEEEEEQRLSRKKRIKKIEKSKSMFDYIPDDLVHEILIRLPNLKSAVQCSCVCKSWSSVVSRPDFVPTFMDHHRPNLASSLKLIFGDMFFSGNPIRIHLPHNQSSSSLPAAGGLVDSFPWLTSLYTPYATLMAMCQDLLLVKISTFYYVCNPLSGQMFLLPQHPTIQDPSGYLPKCGLVLEPNDNDNDNDNDKSDSNSKRRYRVMFLFHSRHRIINDIDTAYVYVFSSETGQWSELGQNRLLRTLESNDVVASNGVLYWIHLRFKRLVAFYPFRVKSSHTKQWRVIPLPDGFKYPGGIGDEDYSHPQLRLGLFQGRPRLSQLFRVDSQHLCLKVWDLTYNNGDVNAEPSMPLVHHVKIEAADVNSMSVISVLAFHPSHNNQIYMLRNRKLYLYDIETKKQVEVAEIHSDFDGKMPDLSIFPFVHPVWPTLV